MYRSLKKTLTSSLTVQYAIGPVLVFIYKLGQDFSGNPSQGFAWQDVLIPFFAFLIIVPQANFRLFSGRLSLSRWSWYLFAAALVIAVSVTHSIARTGGPIAFPALLVLGGMLPFIGVMKVYRLAIIGGSFIPAYLITLWMTRPAELLETPLDHFWVSFMMLLGVAAVLTRSRIDSSRTERIAELRRRAGRASREVAAEKQRGDRLLLNILPENIADELKSKGRVDPVRYESATVLFTDFKGFTGLAEKMEPENLVGELDRCFRAFDTIAARHGLEKLKTIGDSYMCAGGIPVPSLSHALDCCRAALEMRDYIEELKKVRRAEGKTVWEIRIGIHSGPLVAGVIGESKFSYDVWGDTVNTASRPSHRASQEGLTSRRVPLLRSVIFLNALPEGL